MRSPASSVAADEALRAATWTETEVAMHRISRGCATLPQGSFIGCPVTVATRDSLGQPTSSLSALIDSRRTCRTFATASLDASELLDVVLSSLRGSDGRPAFATPGNISAISTMLLINTVHLNGAMLEQGMYEITPDDRSLNRLSRISFEQLRTLVDMKDITTPAAILLLCVHMKRRRKYANAYDLGLLETGQALQNIVLFATNRNLGTCVLGSVFDEPYWSAVSAEGTTEAVVDRHGVPVVAVAVGRPRPIDSERMQ
ncbi:nitroreductase family protein [Aldersonia sp. NBC_00410]|uniref:nitroreductase family protein n=1 Tax=Aldersonia sp. NBC_00410 TaxID=2975954 RepID=UPI00338D4EEB